MLAITSVTKRYDKLTALDDISLSIAPGEFFGLLGPNGAGKTTLMSLIAGLKRPDSGTIAVSGSTATAGAVAARQNLGLVPQSLALYDDLSAEENLHVFGQLFGLDRATLKARIDEGLTAVGLADRRKDRVKTFSGGMKRRLNIIAALLHRPKLLLCDEPTVGVDPQSRNAIFEFLEARNAEGLTIIYSTHYMEEATRLCSRIAIIDHGKILADGTLNHLLGHLPSQEQLTLPATSATTAALPALAAFGSVTTTEDVHQLALQPDAKLSAVFTVIEKYGVPTSACTLSRPGLEDVFLHLTGKAFRE
ncbi:ABC transporter ATP-binding protein [Synoicihabitans lomoniglobus]|uniref:ABC transporter ATP-binding protein n=1 Tax=Synoicihabitans lomoniglobus TaxID=2909285 RepID=A0AAF0CP86_9BACT|nr:ABC transporter ATP-binding protein [Opitutaceae bacterium LMO-M01]WED63574.1 ABC transporter ATP-binding protein [Opitutaceae bacterium LMO-M01]